jgi:hypothetical protein
MNKDRISSAVYSWRRMRNQSDAVHHERTVYDSMSALFKVQTGLKALGILGTLDLFVRVAALEVIQ